MQHRPRKRFGQNFLQDNQVIDAILSAIYPVAGDNIVEIGPGLGALTKPLLKSIDHLCAIEIDRDLQEKLKELPQAVDKLQIINADALTIDYSRLGTQLRIIGNLPYNISTPLLIRLLHFVGNIKDMHFMLQKEVVARIAATPGNKDFGRLSVMTQFFCQTDYLFDVPPSAFYPRPKVDSAVIRLTPYQTSPYPHIPFATLEKVVAKAFGMRRKTLANNLKPMINVAELQSLGIDPGKRPEQLAVKEYAQIAKFISK